MKFFALCLMVFGAECVVGGIGRMVFPFLNKRQTDCAPEQLQHCLAPVQYLENPFSGSKLENLSDPLVLDRTCTLLSDAQTCASNYVSNCYPAAASDFDIQNFQSIVSYVCSPQGRDVILTASNCLKNPELDRSTQQCNDQMGIGMQQIFVEPNPDLNSACGLMDDFSKCVEDTVRAKCSEEAATFMKGLVSRLTTPYRNMMGCDIQLRMARDLFKFIEASLRK